MDADGVYKMMVDPCYCAYMAVRMLHRDEFEVHECKVTIRKDGDVYVIYARSKDGRGCVLTVW